MNRVDIAFDCLPLRSISRLDIPLDASPGYRKKCEAIKEAMETHGTHNTYFLHNATCEFFLTNDPDIGRIRFKFQGTVFTDSTDKKSISAKLDVSLMEETCDWLTEPIVNWMEKSVEKSVQVEFNRYIEAGDLNKTEERLQELQKKQESDGGYMGMYL